MRFALALTLLLGSAGCDGPSAPPAVDPSLHAVASTGAYRFLEYRLCSPEHCWSQAFLEWFDLDAADRSIAATAELSELGYGKAVESARWVWSDEQPRLELRVVPSHGGFEPYTLLVEPGPPGRYTSSPATRPADEKQPAGATQPADAKKSAAAASGEPKSPAAETLDEMDADETAGTIGAGTEEAAQGLLRSAPWPEPTSEKKSIHLPRDSAGNPIINEPLGQPAPRRP